MSDWPCAVGLEYSRWITPAYVCFALLVATILLVQGMAAKQHIRIGWRLLALLPLLVAFAGIVVTRQMVTEISRYNFLAIHTPECLQFPGSSPEGVAFDNRRFGEMIRMLGQMRIEVIALSALCLVLVVVLLGVLFWHGRRRRRFGSMVPMRPPLNAV